MDRITKSLLDRFVEENGLAALPEDSAFEHFAGQLVTATHHSETFLSDDIHVGEGGDVGIDTVAVIVNGSLVTDAEEIADLAETNGYLDATLIFTQATRSSSFEAARIGSFGFGVVDFLRETPTMPQNEAIAAKGAIVDALFEMSNMFRKGKPCCYLYYVTTGRWTDDPNLVARRDAVRSDVEELNLFRTVECHCIGADELQDLYRQSKNAIQTEIVFENRVVVPELPNVEQAYLGLLPAPEFLKLVQNENWEMLSSVFFDNVRWWQDWNPVNTEMRETLDDPSTQSYFPLLNNGVTIVARQVTATGNRFLVEDYQVVNGCQTSFVLHDVQGALDSEVHVPVRLIATDNADIRNSIIKATNRQTPVTDEQLLALLDFPRKLETYFPTFDGHKKLYYERQSRQYAADENVEKVRVITIRDLVRAFASVFLRLPHRTTRNYKALLSQIGTQIFQSDHCLEPYYVAAYAHYRLEFLFRNQILPSDLKPARYHLLMAYPGLASPELIPRQFSGAEIRRYSTRLMETLWDDTAYRTVFDEAAGLVRAVAQGDMDRDNIRTETFTESLVREVSARGPVTPPEGDDR